MITCRFKYAKQLREYAVGQERWGAHSPGWFSVSGAVDERAVCVAVSCPTCVELSPLSLVLAAPPSTGACRFREPSPLSVSTAAALPSTPLRSHAVNMADK